MQPMSSHRADAFCRITSVSTMSSSTELKDLIQMVLHHPDLNADEVDHDMQERLMRAPLRAVEVGDIVVIYLWEEGDRLQDNTFVKRKESNV